MRPEVGNVVRYYDRQRQYHVEARVLKVEIFGHVFGCPDDGTYYLTLDNDMGIHENQVKVVI